MVADGTLLILTTATLMPITITAVVHSEMSAHVVLQVSALVAHQHPRAAQVMPPLVVHHLAECVPAT